MTNVDNTPAAPNANRLLIAGFMAILAAGVGFAIRGGIFDNWGAEFGFTASQLGAIGGAGVFRFCFGVIIWGGFFDYWGAEFCFTASQLGAIGGAGFSGFCFGIIIGGVICDRIGYGKLVILAFAPHVL